MMNSYPTKTNRRTGGLLALVVLAALLAACGGQAPTPIVVVVTRSFTPTAETLPTAGSEATLASAGSQFVVYEHPSGAFRLDLPQGATLETDEDAVSLVVDDSLLLVGFTVPEEPLGGDDLKAAIPSLVDVAMVEEGLIASYSDLEIEANQAGDAASGRMAVMTEQFGSGEAEMLLWQVDHVLYVMILVTPDYAAAREFWTRAMDSLVPSAANVPLPDALPPTQAPEPTSTLVPLASPTTAPAAQPTATLRPQPTATRPPQPTATPRPSLPAGQGCYLFVNEIGAEVTVTFTAQDRPWNDSFKIPAGGTREYCLDPGRYTYTIDAPPPWSSVNGELTVNAGDRYRWPIRGG